MMAAQNGNLAIMKILVEHGANIENVDDDNFNALHYAAWGGCADADVFHYMIDELGMDWQNDGGTEERFTAYELLQSNNPSAFKVLFPNM